MIINTPVSIFSKKIILTAFCLLFTCKNIFSQTDTSDVKPAPASGLSQAMTSLDPTPYEVVGVTSSDDKHPDRAGLEDVIYVNIQNIKGLVKEAQKTSSRILLYINEIPVKDAMSTTTEAGIEFYLPHEGDVIEAWNTLIAMRGTNEFFIKRVAISVGIEGKPPIATKVNGMYNKSFTLVLVQKKWFIFCLAIIVIIIIMFLILAKKTDMLRDSGLPPPNGRKPFSLSRMQMALWFIVIISAWLLLYVCLHRFNNLSESVLILMGITAGTGVGCVALDTNKTGVQCSPSRGFFTDLVSYNSGVSLFRFQNVAWTIVLILVFIRTVVFYLKMPDFDSTLLMLMGISSGTYIGGKVTEKKDEKTNLTQ